MTYLGMASSLWQPVYFAAIACTPKIGTQAVAAAALVSLLRKLLSCVKAQLSRNLDSLIRQLGAWVIEQFILPKTTHLLSCACVEVT